MTKMPKSRGDRSTSEKQRTLRRTLRTWRVRRPFRHWKRPEALPWPDVHEDIAYLTRELGRWHPHTLAARSRASSWLSLEGRHTDVLRLAEADVAERTAEFGADDPDTLGCRSSLAWSRRRVGDLDGAVAEARVVAEDSARVLGPDHADTHRRRASLARFLAENGEAAEGVRLLRDLYAESQAFRWKRRDETRSIRTTLVTALELNGDLQEALDLLDEEIQAERGTIYGVDENLGDHEMKRLQEWRTRLASDVALQDWNRRRKQERRKRRKDAPGR
ncbi:tetratricopeptide repeat protein [Streptomyces pratensis]|uniref:tetratricopeptide repeat protein n=1 Tax=Streptomyces pratensis TaxID=1169025 RepID=UPI0037B03A62